MSDGSELMGEGGACSQYGVGEVGFLCRPRSGYGEYVGVGQVGLVLAAPLVCFAIAQWLVDLGTVKYPHEQKANYIFQRGGHARQKISALASLVNRPVCPGGVLCVRSYH